MNERLCVLPLALCGFCIFALVTYIAWAFSASEEERQKAASKADPRNKPVNPWHKRL